MGKETYLYGKAWALADCDVICLILPMQSPDDDNNGVLSKWDADDCRCSACCAHLELLRLSRPKDRKCAYECGLIKVTRVYFTEP